MEIFAFAGSALSGNQHREELSEQLGDLGERIAGVEARLGGIADQAKTTNVYLHTLLERGLKP